MVTVVSSNEYRERIHGYPVNVRSEYVIHLGHEEIGAVLEKAPKNAAHRF